jgi:Predicted glycosyltransferases
MLPPASVVIVTRNRADSLARALGALRKLDYPNYEIVVVDNDSTDHTKQIIEENGARYVFAPSQEGIGSCRNRGVTEAKGEIVAFCDDDCVPASQWLSQFAKRLAAEPDVGLLGGRVINVGFPSVNGKQDKLYKGRSRMGRNGKLIFVEDIHRAEFFGNMNLAFRKHVVEEVGNYDPFFNVMEEIDLELKIRRAGYEVAFEPDAVLEHHYTGLNYKKRHFFYGPDLVRLYFCMKHFRPSGAGQWIRFLLYEVRLLGKELFNAFRKFVSVIMKGQFGRLPSVFTDAVNSVTARLALPWLLWRARSNQKTMDRITED